MTAAVIDADKGRRVLTALLALCAIMPLIWAVKLMLAPGPLYPDFFGLWSFGRFVLTHTPAAIYDGRALPQFQAGLGLPANQPYEFFYPPWMLLILAPFGALPYAVGRIVWLAVTFAAYAAALTAWRWPRPAIGLLVLAPSSAVCFLVGQNGFLTAALMLGGLRLLPARPLLAGLLFGALVCKPQLAVMVPFVLLFGRQYRAIAGAALSIAVLSLAATLAFGAGIWGAWAASFHNHATEFAPGRDALRDMMPTVTAALRLLGGGAVWADAAQAACALAGLLAVWRVRGRFDEAALAVPPLATFMATPYAFDYDLPMVTGAVLAVLAACLAGRLDRRVFAVLLGCLVVPMLLPARLGPFAALVPVIFAGGLAVLCLIRPAGIQKLP